MKTKKIDIFKNFELRKAVKENDKEKIQKIFWQRHDDLKNMGIPDKTIYTYLDIIRRDYKIPLEVFV